MPVNETSWGVRPYGGRDADFAAAMKRVEAAADPQPTEDPRDPIGRTRTGLVERRDGSVFHPGPLLDVSDLPLLD